jgi:hypothetical protein
MDEIPDAKSQEEWRAQINAFVEKYGSTPKILLQAIEQIHAVSGISLTKTELEEFLQGDSLRDLIEDRKLPPIKGDSLTPASQIRKAVQIVGNIRSAGEEDAPGESDVTQQVNAGCVFVLFFVAVLIAMVIYEKLKYPEVVAYTPAPSKAEQDFEVGSKAPASEKNEMKRRAAAAYIGLLDAKHGRSASDDELRRAGLNAAEIEAYKAGNEIEGSTPPNGK